MGKKQKNPPAITWLTGCRVKLFKDLLNDFGPFNRKTWKRERPIGREKEWEAWCEDKAQEYAKSYPIKKNEIGQADGSSVLSQIAWAVTDQNRITESKKHMEAYADAKAAGWMCKADLLKYKMSRNSEVVVAIDLKGKEKKIIGIFDNIKIKKIQKKIGLMYYSEEEYSDDKWISSSCTDEIALSDPMSDNGDCCAIIEYHLMG